MAVGILRAVSAIVSSMAKKVRIRREKSIVDASKIAPSWGPYFSRGITLIPFRGKRNQKTEERETSDTGEEDEIERYGEEDEEEEREGGVWQKTILMGEKCQPLEFSGAIFYDCDGRRLPAMPPKSPLRSSLVPVKTG